MKNGFFSDVYRLTTAGSSSARVNGLRAFTGKSISILRSMVNSRVVLLNCSATACAETVTVSTRAPGFKLKFTVTSARVCTSTPSCCCLEKPCDSADAA